MEQTGFSDVIAALGKWQNISITQFSYNSWPVQNSDGGQNLISALMPVSVMAAITKIAAYSNTTEVSLSYTRNSLCKSRDQLIFIAAFLEEVAAPEKLHKYLSQKTVCLLDN